VLWNQHQILFFQNMKLGLGLYRHQLNRDHYRFAKQCGCSHLVIHLVDYFKSSRSNQPGDQPLGDHSGWGRAGDSDKLWTMDEIRAIREEAATEGLEIAAIENFDPAHWHDILLDGPQWSKHIENVKSIIRAVGGAGVQVMGYNFSIAGVAGRIKGPFARGGAEAVGMEKPYEVPIPNGMAWNMVVDPNAPVGVIPRATQEQLWDRFSRFLNEILPVAEEAGVAMALHPDDPPMPTIRQQPRLVYQPSLYRRVMEINPSPNNQIELCVGTLAETTEGNFYEAVEDYAAQKRIGYVHLRNVRGTVPNYRETFIDEGDVDVFRILHSLHKNNFQGVIIPDHAPQMTCAAPWHSGMAFTLGYLKAAIQAVTAAATKP
jgi:mannonate dehydratase